MGEYSFILSFQLTPLAILFTLIPSKYKNGIENERFKAKRTKVSKLKMTTWIFCHLSRVAVLAIVDIEREGGGESCSGRGEE